MRLAVLDRALHALSYLHVALHLAGRHWEHVMLVFGVLPILDTVVQRTVPTNANAHPRSARHTLYFDLLLLGYLPVLLAAIYTVPIQGIGTYLSLGLLCGQGINIAHELIHKTGCLRRLGQILLTLVCYPHWDVHHLRGHHRHVGRSRDPATAPLSMSVYRFIPRSIAGGVADAWSLDPVHVLTSSAVTLGFLTVSWHKGILHLHAGAALIGIGLLEMINYLEHYGLRRAASETVSAHHSWDAPEVISTYLLFKLPFHAHHHLRAHEPYRQLQKEIHAPQLPYGYPTMILLTLIPPLFFRIVHPRLPSQGDIGEQKAAASRILGEFGVSGEGTILPEHARYPMDKDIEEEDTPYDPAPDHESE